jgi:hypothetical protein
MQESSNEDSVVKTEKPVILSKEAETCRKLLMDRNTSILLAQLNLCRFLYYITRNRLPLLRKVDKDRLNCLIYKHIIKITEKLGDSNTTNWFKLSDFDSYRHRCTFQRIYATICEYGVRYRQDFTAFR